MIGVEYLTGRKRRDVWQRSAGARSARAMWCDRGCVHEDCVRTMCMLWLQGLVMLCVLCVLRGLEAACVTFRALL